MGPLVTRSQQKAALEGVQQLAAEASIVCGGNAPQLPGINAQKSAFIAPTLMRAKDGATAKAVHEVEIFGPAATVLAYRDLDDACALVARGGGSLVASVYGEDKEFLLRMVTELGAGHGRILAIDPAIATAHTGHGIVMPQCNHGGPGRAGAGEELGGAYGLRFYHQRLAVQGSSDLLASVQAQAASLH
jgi:3,4-dehydroadipyl-CoA semialdehyde dehydrogenase